MDVVTLGAALKGAKAYTDATIAPLLGGVHYRGSVNYFNNLPSNPSEGDAYTVKYSGTSGTNPDGTEYVWALDTDDNTYKWIGFSPDTYTKTEIDTLLGNKQNTVLGAWTAGTATSHVTPTETDTVLEALQKIDNNQRNNETNISLIKHTANTSLYFQETEPENPTIGDYWISTVGNKIYGRTAQLFNYVTMEGQKNILLLADGEVVSSPDWAITDYIPCEGTEFTINPIGGVSPAICLYDANQQYITGKGYATGGASTKTAVTITAITTAKFIRFAYNITDNVSDKDDLSTIMLNAGSTAATYEPYLKWQ